ncbi:hypothetical protein [Peterkaempfera sp. SMS 1(5)a]|uniref:hypothetical protein n=1 Tax=Peterkaempfera podocarpi TaxID=3232308 RepID=UPI003672CCC8
MDNAQMWALIVGAIAPLVIAVINQPTWSAPAKAAITAVASVLIGLGTAYFAGDFAGKDVVTSILTAFVAAITAYHGFFKPSTLAPRLERATSLTRSDVAKAA